ncbi:MAG TPA: VWA domain-containing protein [Usitatibacter sp.]|nr:VWA domain-containing protein [Usitatibacter sp.]
MTLAANVMHFARVLRGAGLPIGTDKVLDAVRVLPETGIASRQDWHATLSTLFLTRHEQQAVFDEVFARFWRDPALEERMRAALLPKVEGRAPKSASVGRVAEAMSATAAPMRRPDAPPETGVDATLTFSAEERLRHVDFDKMTRAEWDAARKLVEHLHLPVPEVRTRRYVQSARGRSIDLPATLRAMARNGGEITRIPRRKTRTRPPPLVMLCDVSGSMHRYTRMFLHLAHAISQEQRRVSTFVFGTRLTNVTRQLRGRDVDEALSRVSESADDWAGGTRIATSLHAFNRDWARRLLAQNACVVLVTDGLERDESGTLGREMARLSRAAHRLVWLNPLLRFEGFEPRATGIAAMLPHADAFLPMHNLATLSDLARELA